MNRTVIALISLALLGSAGARAQTVDLTPYTITTLAGTNKTTGSTDGTGAAARFSLPMALAVDSGGTVYVADTLNQLIRKVAPGGAVTTIAGSGQLGGANGVGTAATFDRPSGIAVDSAGNLYVADTANQIIRKITPSGSGGSTVWTVTTLAGAQATVNSLNGGYVDATGTAAQFSYPEGLAVDSGGNVYVADEANDVIRKITPAGVVSTVAGTGKSAGYVDAAGSAARFSQPYGVAADSAGNLYVADTINDVIRKITPSVSGGVTTWTVTTLAGAAGSSGYGDGSGTAAQFNSPRAVAVDHSGNIFVADTSNAEIRGITAGGAVTTLAGGNLPGTDGAGFDAGFSNPGGIAVDSAGTVYVADTNDSTIRSGVADIPPAFTLAASPSSLTVAAGRTAVFNASASGNPAPSYQWTLNGSAHIPGAASTTDPILMISGAIAADNGSYTCTATNLAGSATTTATLSVSTTAAPGYLINLSARADVLSGGNILIVGLGVSGSSGEPMLLRGVGPGLTHVINGFTGYVPTTQLTLLDNHSTAIISDAGWGNAFTSGASAVSVNPVAAATSGLFTAVGAFNLTAGSTDSAMEVTAPPGNYTAELTGLGTDTGVGLAEIYDAGPGTNARLDNLSARADIGAGGNLLIGGFNIAGAADETVLIRAMGPTLGTAFPSLAGQVLTQPVLTLFSGSTPIYSNTVWGGDPVLAAAESAVGAYPLPAQGSQDSMLLLSLPPGGYTAEVTGVNGGTGIATIEIYEVY